MITLALVINVILAVALGAFVLAIVGFFIAMTGGTGEIPSHQDTSIIGDGAWEFPSARISDMPEREEV